MVNFIQGDWRYFWPENINTIVHIPSAWDSVLNTGLGVSSLPSLWITSYLNFSGIFNKIGLPWEVIGVVFWIMPPVIFSFLSLFLLFSYVFPGKKIYAVLSGILYVFNTYFLLIFGGGQLGIALAYSISPFVLLQFMKLFHNVSTKKSLLFGLSLSVLLLFDPRMLYITIIGVGVYWLFFFSGKKLFRKILFVFLIPLGITLLLHSYWILPLLMTHGISYPNELTDPRSLSFFSFADFPHTIAFLHPNWPDNVFGKVYFLQPEFLIIPIFAYTALLFTEKLQSEKSKVILLFACFGLLGSFLSKGVNDPFGFLYEWNFTHVPGFQLFRDPTKWYLLISISYAMLIPFSISNIFNVLSIKKNHVNTYLQNIVVTLTMFSVLMLIRPVFSNHSIFTPKPIPRDYILLKDFLVKEKNYSRSLWIPTWQRFGFFSNIHPAVKGQELLQRGSAAGQIQVLQSRGVRSLLHSAGIAYIIIPYDSNGEIFMKDHVYNQKEYKNTIEALEKIPWLTRIYGFGQIAVFKTQNYSDHIVMMTQNKSIVPVTYHELSQTQYNISLTNGKRGNMIIFAESYDPNWIVLVDNHRISSRIYQNHFNSFLLPQDGLKNMNIEYQPQDLVRVGLVLSILTLFCTGMFLRYV